MSSVNPLLLTLNINAEAQQLFNALRKEHFPPNRNFLDSHLMLFHQLPAHEEQISYDIESLAKKHSTLSLRVTEIRSIGNGVAYKVESDELQNIHKELQQKWARWLIPQDKNKLWPHITIQNKVQPDVAKQLLKKLSADFKSFEIQGTGFTLWEYRGGPWKHIQDYPFKGH